MIKYFKILIPKIKVIQIEYNYLWVNDKYIFNNIKRTYNYMKSESAFWYLLKSKRFNVTKNGTKDIGIPDFTIINDNDTIFVEHKSNNSTLSESQKEWCKNNTDKTIYVVNTMFNNEIIYITNDEYRFQFEGGYSIFYDF